VTGDPVCRDRWTKVHTSCSGRSDTGSDTFITLVTLVTTVRTVITVTAVTLVSSPVSLLNIPTRQAFAPQSDGCRNIDQSTPPGCTTCREVGGRRPD
jgi:hypothetical protein